MAVVTEAAKEMSRPGIIVIGSSYHIKIEDVIILLDGVKNLEKALAYVVAYYYVLHVNYPQPLVTLFGFLEYLFGMKLSVNRPRLNKFGKNVVGGAYGAAQ
jgi:hypothetical protein